MNIALIQVHLFIFSDCFLALHDAVLTESTMSRNSLNESYEYA
jgi:hypothetical protein